MYTKDEKKALTERFWSEFDDYCNTIADLSWRKKKWILYDTKISHIDLKFDIGRDFAMVALEINHKSDNRRLRVYELVERYRLMLEQGFPMGLIWDFCYVNANNLDVCRIYIKKQGVDFRETTDWPSIYSFFAVNMLQLQDNFLEIQEVLKEEVNLLYREE